MLHTPRLGAPPVGVASLARALLAATRAKGPRALSARGRACPWERPCGRGDQKLGSPDTPPLLDAHYPRSNRRADPATPLRLARSLFSGDTSSPIGSLLDQLPPLADSLWVAQSRELEGKGKIK